MQNNGKPAIIFDFGGVLIDWNVYYIYRNYLPTDQMIDEFLGIIEFHSWNEELQRGIVPYSTRISEVCAKFPEYEDLIKVFNSRWFEAVGEVISETQDILKKLKIEGYPVYGLSNWPLEKFIPIKERLTFLDLLDDYMISGDIHLIKPEPEFFYAFLDRINRAPEECIFIDDRKDNVIIAEKIGIKAINYVSPDTLIDDLNYFGIKIDRL